jgi:16S rRNA (cytosine1402-N4)-methyltransferase
MDAGHTPVLAEEAVQWLRVDPCGTYVDATLGLGGHALKIAEQLTTGRLLGLDRDSTALEIAGERLKDFKDRVILVKADFSMIDEVIQAQGLGPVNGVLADLGVSSMELDTAERGFSFRLEGPLDMRMDSEAELTAAEIVNETAEGELADLLYQFGEERDSRRIARSIVRARPIRSTTHLATVVAGARTSRGRQKLHPATKTFLALRIAVNRELEALGQFLKRVPATLASEGRWVVLSYHSLEDRMVKQEFRRLDQEGVVNVLTRRVLRPSDAEVEANPRARSAKMRVAEKCSADPNGVGAPAKRYERFERLDS